MSVDPYLYRQPCEHVLAPILSDVPTYFSCRGENFAAIVPAPLLVLDAVAWTTSLRNTFLRISREAGESGDTDLERELASDADDVSLWLEDPGRTTKAFAPLAYRQSLRWPTVTYGNFQLYARHIRANCQVCDPREVQAAVHTKNGRIHVHALPRFVTILTHTGIDGVPCQWCDHEMEGLVDSIREGRR